MQLRLTYKALTCCGSPTVVCLCWYIATSPTDGVSCSHAGHCIAANDVRPQNNVRCFQYCTAASSAVYTKPVTHLFAAALWPFCVWQHPCRQLPWQLPCRYIDRSLSNQFSDILHKQTRNTHFCICSEHAPNQTQASGFFVEMSVTGTFTVHQQTNTATLKTVQSFTAICESFIVRPTFSATCCRTIGVQYIYSFTMVVPLPLLTPRLLHRHFCQSEVALCGTSNLCAAAL